MFNFAGTTPRVTQPTWPVLPVQRGRKAAPAKQHLQATATQAPSAADTLITVEDVSKSHDGMRFLFEELSFSLARGERMAIIGANGSGKTSLLKLLAGTDQPDEGSILVKRNTHVSYLPQLVDLPPEQTALEAVVQSESLVAATVREYNRLLEQGESVDRQKLNEAMDKMNALGAWELEGRAKDVLALLGIPDPNMKIKAMSGGQARKVAVSSALLGTPEVLILDEPTNHMDVQFIDWMTETIKSLDVTLLLVTHDRAFMEDCCTSILELDSGRGYVHNVGGRGSYEQFREKRAARRAAQAAAAQDARVVLRKETEWMARQPKARESKSKARVDAFEELTAKARSGPKQDVSVDFRKISSGMARQGKKVMVMKDCTKLWDGRPVIDSFTYDFAPGERIGIAGPNGSGKSTLLDMITGRAELDSGIRVEGDTTVVGYFQQHPPEVNPRLKIIDHVAKQAAFSADKESMGVEVPPDKMLKMLGFDYQRQQQYVSTLSGGERRRLHLASILAMRPNLLVLDEPTNDLDLSTIENLEELLRGYLGCVIVVSHDRAFMKNAVDTMFVLEGNGQSKVQKFAGDYEEYIAYIEKRRAEQQLQEAAAASAARAESTAAQASESQTSASSEAAEEKPLRKLGFREKDEYMKLEKRIEDATEEKAQLEAKIAETAQTGDFEAVTGLTEELQTLSDKIDTMSDRWLELAERAEVAGTI